VAAGSEEAQDLVPRLRVELVAVVVAAQHQLQHPRAGVLQDGAEPALIRVGQPQFHRFPLRMRVPSSRATTHQSFL